MLFPKLSKEGQRWLILTRTYLQLALEQRLLTHPEQYDLEEGDSGAFRKIAFRTHPQAYSDGGLESLPVTDLIAIALTPDIGDLANMAGVAQVLTMVPGVTVTQAGEFVTEGGMLLSREDGEKWLSGDPNGPPAPFQDGGAFTEPSASEPAGWEP